MQLLHGGVKYKGQYLTEKSMTCQSLRVSKRKFKCYFFKTNSVSYRNQRFIKSCLDGRHWQSHTVYRNITTAYTTIAPRILSLVPRPGRLRLERRGVWGARIKTKRKKNRGTQLIQIALQALQLSFALISLLWPIHIINSVDKVSLFWARDNYYVMINSIVWHFVVLRLRDGNSTWPPYQQLRISVTYETFPKEKKPSLWMVWKIENFFLRFQSQIDTTGCHRIRRQNSRTILGGCDYKLPFRHQEKTRKRYVLYL